MSNRNIRIETHSGLGMAWFVGWLFTVGFLSKGFWGGVLALICLALHARQSLSALSLG